MSHSHSHEHTTSFRLYADIYLLISLNFLLSQSVDPKNIFNIALEGDDPRQVIVDYAKQNNIDIVVMGTRGLGALSRYGVLLLLLLLLMAIARLCVSAELILLL